MCEWINLENHTLSKFCSIGNQFIHCFVYWQVAIIFFVLLPSLFSAEIHHWRVKSVQLLKSIVYRDNIVDFLIRFVRLSCGWVRKHWSFFYNVSNCPNKLRCQIAETHFYIWLVDWFSADIIRFSSKRNDENNTCVISIRVSYCHHNNCLWVCLEKAHFCSLNRIRRDKGLSLFALCTC